MSHTIFDRWDGAVKIENNTAYVPKGSEISTPFSGHPECNGNIMEIRIGSVLVDLQGIVLIDDAGVVYTYFKQRDIGNALECSVS